VESSASPARSDELKRITRFLAVGMLNTAFGYLVFTVSVLGGISAQMSLLIATLLGVAFNFFSTGRLVFAHHGGVSAAGRFLAVYAITYALNAWLLAWLLARFGLSSLVAQLCCIGPVVALNYVLMRAYVFRRPAKAI
jgi:putative flippase GtrA